MLCTAYIKGRVWLTRVCVCVALALHVLSSGMRQGERMYHMLCVCLCYRVCVCVRTFVHYTKSHLSITHNASAKLNCIVAMEFACCWVLIRGQHLLSWLADRI